MRPLSISIFALALAAPAAAQFTSPPGYISTEGGSWNNVSTLNGYSIYFGRYADMQFQQVDREIKAGGVQVLTSAGYRLDARNHSTSTAMGRSWTNVELSLSDGDYDTMGRNFASNQTSTPSVVFSGSVTWPSQVGAPATTPAPWDAQLAFPFGTGGTSSSYVYAATDDLCMTYKFTGGTLANSGAWSGTSGTSYYHDGLYVSTATTYGRNVYKNIGTTTGDCRDSSRPSGYASGSVQVGLYGPAYTQNPAYTNKAVAQIFGSNTAPNSNVIHAVGIGGSRPGIDINAFGCYNLMIDLNLLGGLFNIATNASGSRTWLYVPIGDLSALAPLGRTVSIWSQAAWTDSATGQTMLTAADRCTPDFGRVFNSTTPKRKSSWASNLTATQGGSASDSFIQNPLTRFN